MPRSPAGPGRTGNRPGLRLSRCVEIACDDLRPSGEEYSESYSIGLNRRAIPKLCAAAALAAIGAALARGVTVSSGDDQRTRRARPTISARGSVPHCRLSNELARLSPSTKYEAGGTICDAISPVADGEGRYGSASVCPQITSRPPRLST